MKGQLQMDKKNKRLYLPVIAGALGLGWGVKAYINKIKLGDHESLLQKIKNAEQKLYQDGLQRANELDLIKKEVKTKTGCL